MEEFMKMKKTRGVPNVTETQQSLNLGYIEADKEI